MFKIDQATKQINLTRGDKASIEVKALNKDESLYTFQVGDKVKLSIYEAKNLSSKKLEKEVEVTESTQSVVIDLTSEDTKIDDLIIKPKNYWYEIQLNNEQTIIGYDENGAKLFTLYPEGE